MASIDAVKIRAPHTVRARSLPASGGGCTHAGRQVNNSDDDAPAWARQPWPARLQKILDGLEINDDLDEGARRYLQLQLYRGEKYGLAGDGHVVMTLRCITESEGNGGALTGMVVHAVSSAIRSYPDHGMALIEAFDKIPLRGVLEQMRALEYFYEREAQPALVRILRHKLRCLQPSPPTEAELREASKRARVDAKRAAEESIRRNIRKRLEIGLKIAELRDTTPDNKRFGSLVRERLDIHDATFASEVQRVARVYGARQDIVGKVRSWHVLAALASPTLSPLAREGFEEKLLAGKRVSGKEIIAAAACPGKLGTPRRKHSNQPHPT